MSAGAQDGGGLHASGLDAVLDCGGGVTGGEGAAGWVAAIAAGAQSCTGGALAGIVDIKMANFSSRFFIFRYWRTVAATAE